MKPLAPVVLLLLFGWSCQPQQILTNDLSHIVRALNSAAIANGFDNIRVANDDPTYQVDPVTLHFALQYSGDDSTHWASADSAARKLIPQLTEKGLEPDIQFVSLHMLKRYLLPQLAQLPNTEQVVDAMAYYFETAMMLKAEDWDILTSALLALDSRYTTEAYSRYKDYIILGSRQDLQEYKPKLAQIETSNDPDKSKAFEKAHYEHIIYDAEFALKYFVQ